MKPRVSLVVAMAKNRVIGAHHGIPWKLPNEVKLFKEITMGHHIVMGRVTYETINRLLPGRTTVIVTRNPDYRVPGAIVARSIREALDACKDDDEIMVIGGAEIFRETLPIADRIYLTIVDGSPAGDTFMPEFDMAEWRQTSSKQFDADEKHAYAFTFYVLDRKPREKSGAKPAA